MKYLKTCMAGIFLPSIVLPIVLYINILFGNREVLNNLFIHLIPLIWGIWSILTLVIPRSILPKKEPLRLLILGAVLGLIVSVIGVFWIDIPAMLGLSGFFRYLPLIIAPIAYGILWLYVVKPLNAILGIKNF